MNITKELERVKLGLIKKHRDYIFNNLIDKTSKQLYNSFDRDIDKADFLIDIAKLDNLSEEESIIFELGRIEALKELDRIVTKEKEDFLRSL